MREIRRIILHWLGSGNSKNYVTQAAVDAIRRYHIESNGWSDIGYHWLIDRKGKEYPGRPEELAGAHAYGANLDSIGINLMYGDQDSQVTQASIDTLIKRIDAICDRYDLNPTSKTIIGHRDVIATECPGIVYPLIPALIKRLMGQDSGSGKMDAPPETDEIQRIQVIGPRGDAHDALLINSQGYIHAADIPKMLNVSLTWDAKEKTIRFSERR